MALTPNRYYLGQPGTTDTVLATIPSTAGSYGIIKEILLINTTATAVAVTLGVNGTAAANQIVNVSVPGNGAGSTANLVALALSTVLNAGDTIHGLQGTASAVTVEISGISGP